MGIFPRMGQRSKILLPIRANLSEYNEIPELTTISSDTSIPSVQDGPTVVQRYRNLTIGAGATLTTQYRCCGLVVIVAPADAEATVAALRAAGETAWEAGRLVPGSGVRLVGAR